MKLDVVFVAQSGELEVMASILAASLRQFCDDRVHLHIIEPAPETVYGNLSYLSKRFLNSLDVSWYSFENPISDDFKIFNKLNVFKITPKGDKILFLDSDVFVRRPIAPLLPYLDHPFAARAAGTQRFSTKEKHWRQAYQLFGLDVPRMRFPSWGTCEWGPPYLNAGVVLADPALDFSTHWTEACRRIHEDHSIKIKNRNTVQIGMPVALAMQNIPYALLDGRLHFSLNKWRLHHLKKPWVDEEAHIVHYFHSRFLTQDPTAFYEVSQLVQIFGLENILPLSERWQPFLEKFERSRSGNAKSVHIKQRLSSLVSADKTESLAKKRSVKTSVSSAAPVAVVTGIPGAGAGEFSRWLGKNAGVEIISKERAAAVLPMIDRQKQNGRLPGSKSVPGSLLPHIRRIAEALPHARIFVLARNPFATVSAWKATEFDLDETGCAGVDEAALNPHQAMAFKPLFSLKDAASRLAGLWDFFAGLADQHAGNVHIIRREDARDNPDMIRAFVTRVLGLETNALPPGAILTPEGDAPASALLTDWEKACIRAICTNNSGIFDYNLYDDALLRTPPGKLSDVRPTEPSASAALLQEPAGRRTDILEI